MKKLIGLVVIIAALVLGGYYGMGLITERTIKKNVEIINQTNGLFVDIDQYDRGWYSSTAVLNWRIHIPERLTRNQNGQSTTVPAQDYKVQMPLIVYHGPFIFSDSGLKFGLGYARSEVVLPPEYVALFVNTFTNESTKPKLNLSLFVNYMNDTQLHIGLPTFKLISKQGGDQFEWGGMDSHITVSSNLHDIDGALTLDGISLTKNKTRAALVKLTSSYDLHQTEQGLYLGEASLTLPSFVVSENDQKVFGLEQFDLRSSSEVEGGLFNTYFKTSLNKMTAQGKTYGPALLEMSIKNLDAQVLAEINAQANKIQQGTDIERQKAFLAMLPELPKLFGKGAQFQVSKLSFIVPEGAIEGDMLVSLPKGDTGNIFQLLQKVQGHGKLRVPAVVLKELAIASAKQKLLSQPTLQQAMVQQMTNANPADVQAQSAEAKAQEAQEQAAIAQVQAAKKAQGQTTEAPAAAGEVQNNPSQDGSQEQSKPMTVAEVEQQATAEATQKLSAMVQAGLITLQGSDYVIEVDLAQGQLSVNGKSFTPAMMQF